MQTRSKIISVNSQLPFDRCVSVLRESIKRSGLEIVAELAVHRQLKRELGLGLPRCTIFTVWDPVIAYQALSAAAEAPCFMLFNVTVSEHGSQSVVCVPGTSLLCSCSDSVGTRLMARTVGEKTMKVLARMSDAKLPAPVRKDGNHTASWLRRGVQHAWRVVVGGTR